MSLYNTIYISFNFQDELLKWWIF